MKKILVVDNRPISALERIARLVEPKTKPERIAGQHEPLTCRRIKMMREIPQAAAVYYPGEPVKPTNAVIRTMDGTVLRFHSDGSLRHAVTVPKESRAQRRHRLRFGGAKPGIKA